MSGQPALVLEQSLAGLREFLRLAIKSVFTEPNECAVGALFHASYAYAVEKKLINMARDESREIYEKDFDEIVWPKFVEALVQDKILVRDVKGTLRQNFKVRRNSPMRLLRRADSAEGLGRQDPDQRALHSEPPFSRRPSSAQGAYTSVRTITKAEQPRRDIISPAMHTGTPSPSSSTMISTNGALSSLARREKDSIAHSFRPSIRTGTPPPSSSTASSTRRASPRPPKLSITPVNAERPPQARLQTPTRIEMPPSPPSSSSSSPSSSRTKSTTIPPSPLLEAASNNNRKPLRQSPHQAHLQHHAVPLLPEAAQSATLSCQPEEQATDAERTPVPSRQPSERITEASSAVAHSPMLPRQRNEQAPPAAYVEPAPGTPKLPNQPISATHPPFSVPTPTSSGQPLPARAEVVGHERDETSSVPASRQAPSEEEAGHEQAWQSKGGLKPSGHGVDRSSAAEASDQHAAVADDQQRGHGVGADGQQGGHEVAGVENRDAWWLRLLELANDLLYFGKV